MVVGETSHQKNSEGSCRRLLDIYDPFDQLIMDLGKKGVLNVIVVGVGHGLSGCPHHVYSRKPASHQGKHTS